MAADQMIAVPEAITAVISFVAGAAIAIFADPLRRFFFRPRVEIDFAGDDPAFIASTPAFTRTSEECAAEYTEDYYPTEVGKGRPVMVAHNAIYIRVRIRNMRSAVATGCRAYLVGIEREKDEGQFEQTGFYDSVPLAWASRGNARFEKYDLPKGVPMFLDVVSTRDFDPNPECPPEPLSRFRLETQFTPFREADVVSARGTYRLSIVLTGDNFPPVRFQLNFKWDGRWDKVEAWND